jgi:hypothetical protein
VACGNRAHHVVYPIGYFEEAVDDVLQPGIALTMRHESSLPIELDSLKYPV